MAVSKLPESVRSLLRTGIVVTSPVQTIIELVLNSIDAGATSILVRVDLQNFRLEVSDNGSGLQMEDIDKIGTRYMTSKCHSLQDLQTCLTHFGFRGEALASLREVTGFLTIESRPVGGDETYCKTFIRGKPYHAAVSKTKQKCSGTTVTAVEFMYNLPVRRKQIKEAIDLEEIKYQLECVAVIHPQVSIGLRNDITSKTIMQSYKCSSIVQAFSYLFGEKIAGHLALVNYELNGYKLTGHISKLSHTQKHLQFIYVNRRLVLKTKLHKLVNALLAKSYILRPNGPWKNSPISKNLTSAFWLTFPPREKRNKFAVFVLNIACAPACYDISFEPKKTMIEFVDWDTVLKLVDESIREFLARESIGLVEDSPPAPKGRNHSQLSVFQEMEELEKECALASTNVQNPLVSFNNPSVYTVGDDERRKCGVGVQGVHGLPARRRKSAVKQVLSEGTIPEEQQEILSPPGKWCGPNVSSAEILECCSEDPFPPFSNLSDKTVKQAENNCTDLNYSVETCESLLPPPSKIPRRRFANRMLSTKSTDSEDPFSTSRQQYNNARRCGNTRKHKSGEAHKILNMTMGKLKKFSFTSNRKKVRDARHTLKNVVDKTNTTTLNYVQKKSITSTLNKFSFSTPKDMNLATLNNEVLSTKAISSTQTDFSGCGQSEAVFSYTAPVYRKTVRASTYKPPMISKSTQTQDVNDEGESNVEVCLPSAVPTCDMGVNAGCEISTSAADSFFIEPKLISGLARNKKLEQASQKSNVISEITEMSFKSVEASMVASDSLVGKTVPVNHTNLPKSCLKNNMPQEQLFCRTVTSKSKYVSFDVDPIDNSNKNTAKSVCQASRNLCSEDGLRNTTDVQKDKCRLKSLHQRKFYVTSSDFLHSFKVVQKKSVSSTEEDNSKLKNICKSPPSFRTESNSYDNIGNSSDLSDMSCKSYHNSRRALTLETKLEKRYTQHDNLDFSKSIRNLGAGLYIHNTKNHKVHPNIKSVKMKNEIQFSSDESDQLSVDQSPDTPICVVSVPNISSGDESSFLISESVVNFSTNEMNIQKETDSHTIVFPSKESNVDTEVVGDTSSVSSQKVIEDAKVLLDFSCVSSCSLASKAADCCTQAKSSRFHCDTVINHKLNNRVTSLVNKGFSISPDVTSCNIRVECPASCGSSTGVSTPCEQSCVSSLQTFNSPLCRHDINVEGNDSLALSPFGNHIQSCEAPNAEICSPYFSCHGRRTATANCTSRKTKRGNVKHRATMVCPCSKETIANDEKKILGKRGVSVDNEASELIPVKPETFTSSRHCKKCSNQLFSIGSENNAIGVNTFKNQLNDTVEDEDNNATHNIMHGTLARSQGSQRMTSSVSLPCGDELKASVVNDGIESSKCVPKGPLDEKENSTETQISQTCYSPNDSEENFDNMHDKEFNNKDGGADDIPKATDGDSQATSLNSQLLIEVADVAMHSLNANIVCPGEIQGNCTGSSASGLNACLSENSDVQNISSTEKVYGLKEWVAATDANGKKFYVNTRSGITTYEEPVPVQEQASFQMTERYEFLPKGMSPILQVPNGKSSNTLSLTPESREMLNEAITEGGQLQDEPTTVKWGVSATHKPGTCYTELVDRLMSSADRCMAYCEQDVPNTAMIEKYAIKLCNFTFPHSLTKEALAAARVLRQIDKKLIVAVTTMDVTQPPHLVVLFDQHAVHERIRVEQLFRDYQVEGSTNHFKFTDAEPNTTMDLSAQEVRILSSFEDEFHQVGLYYNVVNDIQIQVTKIPTCLHEREKREAKHGSTVLKKYLESLIKEQVDCLIQTRGVACSVPPTLHEIINSEACKGAIKFGHELSTEECQVLVRHLSLCKMPFHCAHGRPSVVPIADLNLIDQQEHFDKPRLWNLKDCTSI